MLDGCFLYTGGARTPSAGTNRIPQQGELSLLHPDIRPGRECEERLHVGHARAVSTRDHLSVERPHTAQGIEAANMPAS